MFKISHKLRLKLLDHDKMRAEGHMTPQELSYHGLKIKVPGVSWTEVTLDLRDEPDLFDECENWKHVRMTYFTRVDTKITIGPYEGLWPTVCDKKNMRVKFLVDSYDAGRRDWRDWFIQGEEYASK